MLGLVIVPATLFRLNTDSNFGFRYRARHVVPSKYGQ
jgi:hypothetical protein